MGSEIVAVVLALITLAGTFVTVRYKDYWKNRPKKLDPLQLFITRYEEDIKDLKRELGKAKETADEALKLVKQKDDEILKLQRQIATERTKYSKLLRRFNILKAKVDKKDKES